MADWIVAPALEVLRKQLNAAFPKRSKVSDGGIGDARHQASASSDHNPHVKNPAGGRVVTARDFTHDPKTGVDCNWLARVLVKNRDPRVKYIIWNRQICSSTQKPWQWRPYSGSNPHDKHLHLSVNADPKHWGSTREWDLDFPDNSDADDVARVTDEPGQEPTSVDIPSAAEAGGGGTSGEAPAAVITKPEPQPAHVPAGITIATEGSSPASLVARVEEVVEVEQLKSETHAVDTNKEPGVLDKVGNKMAAFWTTAGATVLAIGGFLTSTPAGIAISIIGGVVLVGLGYMVINGLRSSGKERRDAEARARAEEFAERERQRVHELQVLTLKSAMDKDLNTVRLVPAPPSTTIESGGE